MQFRSRHSIEVVIAVVAGWLLYWALLAEQLVRRLHTFEAMFLAILLVAMLCTFAIVDLRWTVFREGVWKGIVTGTLLGYISGVFSYVIGLIVGYSGSNLHSPLQQGDELVGVTLVGLGYPLFVLHCWSVGLASALLLLLIRRLRLSRDR
jgi:hypothetical protein